MSDKEALIERLKAKKAKKFIEWGRDILTTKGAASWNGDEYCDEQCKDAAIDALLNDIKPPQDYSALSSVLHNANQPYPTRVTNANDEESLVGIFLNSLLEPASKYLDTNLNPQDDISVVEFLVMKYDNDCPSLVSSEDELRGREELRNQGLSDDKIGNIIYAIKDEAETTLNIYLGQKTRDVENLESSFTNRGIQPKFNGESPNGVEVSATITSKRYNYLTKLAKLFEENPEHKEVIYFVSNLPANSWVGEEEIHLPCDRGELAELHDKYRTEK